MVTITRRDIINAEVPSEQEGFKPHAGHPSPGDLQAPMMPGFENQKCLSPREPELTGNKDSALKGVSHKPSHCDAQHRGNSLKIA